MDEDRFSEDAAASSAAASGPPPSASRKNKKIVGFSCILIAATVWVVSSYWVTDLEGQGVTPLLLTSIANCMFAVVLPVHFIRHYITMRSHASTGARKKSGRDRAGDDDGADEDTLILGGSGAGAALHPEEVAALRRSMFVKALCLWPFWFLALYTYNLSFLTTTVMSNTILSIGATGFFCCLLEVAVVKVTLSALKVSGVLLCILGTVLWTLGNHQTQNDGEGRNTLGGVFLCILSAAMYALVSVALQKFMPKEGKAKDVDMMLFWGFMGLVNFSVMFPLNVLLILSGLHDVSDVPARLYGVVMLKGLVDNLLTDFLWSIAVIYVGATTANVSMSIQTPMVVAIDVVTKRAGYLNKRSRLLNITGALVILAGFVMLNV